MLTDEDRKYILNEHLRNIHHISDIEYQERVWIHGEGPECDDFTETACRFFDLGDPMLKNYKDFGVSEDQYQLLIKFKNAFEIFPGKHDLPQEFINTHEWETIMTMAKEVLKAFNYKRET